MGLERALLRRTWKDAPPDHLAGYLVRGYQNPLINLQSVLARHHLVHQVFGSRFADLERAELEFAVGANRLLRREQKRLAGEAGQHRPHLDDAFSAIPPAEAAQFMDRWRDAIAGADGARISVLEPACGSANDYRFWDASGIAAHIDYRGFDLTASNVANAQRAFPGIDFRIGDILGIDAGDNSFEWVVVHDLFEHLSPKASERAIAEVCRVAKRGVLVSFFNMSDMPDHIVKPLNRYFRNELSLARIRAAFLAHGGEVQSTHIASFARDEFGLKRYYNSKAYTLVLRR